jgi:hypothetical protein
MHTSRAEWSNHPSVKCRLGRYAVSTDIEKAFLHVGLHEDDICFQISIVIWPYRSQEPAYDWIRVLVFGAAFPPFIYYQCYIAKIMTMNSSNPAAGIITRGINVNNVILSFQQKQDLLTYFRYTRALRLMSEAAFNLRSWTLNSSKLRELAPAEKSLGQR